MCAGFMYVMVKFYGLLRAHFQNARFRKSTPSRSCREALMDRKTWSPALTEVYFQVIINFRSLSLLGIGQQMPKDEEALERQHQIELYLDHAKKALQAAASNIEHGFYATAINRAYYSIFYAASALLLSKGLARSKHTGVIAAFREHFVKPGLIEAEYSDIYGDLTTLPAEAGPVKYYISRGTEVLGGPLKGGAPRYAD